MKKIQTTTQVIFWGSFTFLLSVWFFDLSQYLVIAAFALYIAAASAYLKNIPIGLALGALIAFCVQTGKTYSFLMLTPGMVSLERFPEGYSLNISLTVNHVIAVALTGLIANGIITKQHKHIRIIPLDVLVFGFFFWTWLSALFGSNMPEISALYAALSLSTLVKYVFFRLHTDSIKKHKYLIFTVLAAMLLFESVIAIIQYAHGSPLAKSIESQKHIEVFGGGATDETDFIFRPLGTFIHANYLAGFIALLSPIVLALAFRKKKMLCFIVYLISLITSGLTLSRIGWVALLPHGVIFFHQIIRVGKKITNKINVGLKILLLTITGALFFIIISPRLIKSLDVNSSDISNGFGVRVAQLENAIKLISLHPFLGVGQGMNVIEGYNLEPDGVMWSFPSPIHSVFALVLVENGLPAFLLYTSILGYIAFKRRTKELFAMVVATCIIGLAQPFDLLELILLISLVEA